MTTPNTLSETLRHAADEAVTTANAQDTPATEPENETSSAAATVPAFATANRESALTEEKSSVTPTAADSPEPPPAPFGDPPPPDVPPPGDTGGPLPEKGAPEPPHEQTDNDGLDDRPMTLMEHLNELRRRLIRCCIAVGVTFLGCWAVIDPIFNAFVNPLLNALPEGSHPIYTTLPEGFFIRMLLAFVAGVFVASPVIFYQIWAFIAPGLYDDEKKHIIPIAFLSALFFISGGAFCYFIVLPYAFDFLVSFATDTIVAMPRVSDYIDLVLKLIVAFGLIFEMPLFSFFLSRLGIVSADMMRHARRYAVLVIFVMAAILTPPDVLSQLLMAVPMLILYELSILVAAAFGRTKKRGKDAVGDSESANSTKTTAQTDSGAPNNPTEKA